MWKINKERLVSWLKVGIILFGLLFWIFFVFFGIPLSVIENEKILHIYIPSVILVILLPVLVILYYSCLAYKNNKPKYIDWKYVWKDWRVYEWDWDKKCWANWKWKLTWSDWSYYEWEFKNWNISGKWKKYSPSGECYEWDWENGKANWKWKLTRTDWSYYEWEFKDWMFSWKWKKMFSDWWYYEWEFKNWKPHWMWIIKMINWYYYEWEFFEWKRKWKFKKQILSNWDIIEWDFNDEISGIEWVWKRIISWYIFEWMFKRWELNWEWKMTTPEWKVFVWEFENWELRKWKQILKNWEYFEWNWANWYLTWKAKYYFKDGSYYEWECEDTWWQWIWTYVTKKWDKYPTEFPYKIINGFLSCFLSKIKEIDWDLKYIPKSEKEKTDEKNMYLKILEKWTSLQKEIARLHLEEHEKVETLTAFIKRDKSIQNILKFHKVSLKIQEEWHEKFRKLIEKHHIKIEEKSSYYTYWQYLNKLKWMYVEWYDITLLCIKINEFLHPKNILSFITKREKKDKERVNLINNFSEKYEKYVQGCLDWREYEKKFWEHNFKPSKNKKHEKIKK